METFFILTLLLSFLPVGVLMVYVALTLCSSQKGGDNVAHVVDFRAPVSIIIACYNEEKYIANRIENLLEASNWIDGSEIIVVTGGSSDQTLKRLEAYANNPFVHIFSFPDRVAKIAAVNFGFKQAAHDFLVFSDCRQVVKPGSIPSLIRRFSDPLVGTVSSTLVDSKDESKPSRIRAWLNTIAYAESRTRSSLNVFGALYAQRRSTFRELPDDIIFDDLFVVVSTIAQKKRLVQDEHAVIYDVNFNQYYGKGRIKRLARGLLLFLSNHYSLVKRLPRGIRIRFMIFKYLKLILPFSTLLAVLSIVGLAICGSWVIPALAAIIISILLIWPMGRQFMIQYLKIQFFFFIAILHFLSGKDQSVSWEKLHTAK